MIQHIEPAYFYCVNHFFKNQIVNTLNSEEEEELKSRPEKNSILKLHGR